MHYDRIFRKLGWRKCFQYMRQKFDIFDTVADRFLSHPNSVRWGSSLFCWPILPIREDFLGVRYYWPMVLRRGAAPSVGSYTCTKRSIALLFFTSQCVFWDFAFSHMFYDSVCKTSDQSHHTQHAAASFSRITSQISSNCHDHDIIK